MSEIIEIKAREILDSRANPTIEAEVILKNGIRACASTPSGASTGSQEAFELRDKDPKRYMGKGVLKAISNVNNQISSALKGVSCVDLKLIDEILIKLDGTHDKSNLGANAIVAVSSAISKAISKVKNEPLFKIIGMGTELPLPMINIINGGAHANNKLDIQEFMIMPISASNIKEAIRMGAEVFYALKSLISSKNMSTNVGDEGGFAPDISSAKEALDLIIESIEIAGYKAKRDFYVALDIASSELYQGDNKYFFKKEQKIYSHDQLMAFYQELINNYPILSIEDAMAENDLNGWKIITNEFGEKIQLIGDDLFVTNKNILAQGIKNNIANAILVKPNQVGTITETLETINFAKENNYNTIISHRSGETEDSIIAHIAVGTNASQIKTGSLCRSDRTAKYNELIRIEEYLGDSASYAASKAFDKFIKE